MQKREQQYALLIMIFFSWHGAWVGKDTICSSLLKVNLPTNVLWNMPFSSIFPKHMNTDNILLFLPLLLSRFYINSYVRTLKITEIAKRVLKMAILRKCQRIWISSVLLSLVSLPLSLSYSQHLISLTSLWVSGQEPSTLSLNQPSPVIISFPFHQSAGSVTSSRT